MGFELFSLPGLGRRLYYLFQRYVTRSIPRPDMDHALELSLGHFQRMERFSPVPLEQARHFEFGAGWDLFNNLCLYGLGLNQQVSIDISCLARHDLINAVIAYLQDHRPAEMARLPEKPLPPDFAGPLRELYGIDYRPFCDAGATGLEPASVEVITTTNTLEHIPAHALPAILAECHRLLAPGGVMSMKIDYSDHYSHADPNLTPYNFLRFREEQWSRYNPAIHYQNRLRHRDFRRLFREAGFEVLQERAVIPEHGLEMLATVNPAPPFADYPPRELAVTSGWFVLRRG